MGLQEVVDQLAVALCRPVVLDDLDRRQLAASDPAAPVPSPRAPRSAPFAGQERIAVAVRDDRVPLALLWVSTGGLPPLTALDRAAIDSSVELVRETLLAGPLSGEPAPGEPLVRRLLDTDLEVRRHAFTEAVAERWIDRTGGTTVYSVAFDGPGPGIDRVAFGRHVAATKGSGLMYLAESAGTVLLVGRGVREQAISLTRAEALRHRVTVDGIGMAAVDPEANELRSAARAAVSAARIVSQLPETGEAADASELGPWLMLAEIRRDPTSLARFSPAAEALVTAADDVERVTVEHYLDAGASVRLACEALHIHRTTLYYRLENLPPVVREALDDGLARSTLHLALKLARLWEAGGRR
ncbi:helix-turn-helix domain-containing protein [Herbiconiux moechotypicola]|uniref:PucR C-terminal helix-turn-helix domain-containing protein n=1 Tax=Herbiconiux moechotypicola TaxID=637393 RepID=A0ABN3DLA0_9MICO|nr:helix-turn-helix domain-containing protein [Herbiconiux moechotypicola]MCS5730106.1 helix-turn-helix domain-containing protein [Herbiconiux moechotypicola]